MIARALQCFLATLLVLAALMSSAWAGDCPPRLLVVRHEGAQLDDDDRFLIATLKAMGCELQIQRSSYRVTLPRRLELLRDGEIDVLIGLSKFPEREMYGHFSVPFREEHVRMWVRRGDADRVVGKTAQQLVADGWRIIGPSQGWYGPFYEEARKQPGRVVDYKTFEQAMRLLHAHRGDLILGEAVWASAFDESVTGNLHLLPDLIYSEPLYVVFSKRTVPEEFVRRFDVEINKQRARPR